MLSGPARHRPREPCIDLGDELRIPQAQVVVGDPAAAGEDVEGELQGILVDVLPEVLEPFEARLRGSLCRHDHGFALGLICFERRRYSVVLVQAGGERERVLHGELGAGSNREVRCVRGVAEQHDIGMVPGVVAHRREADPPRVVGVHLVAVEDVAEQRTDLGDARKVALPGCEPTLCEGVEARLAPDRIVHLDDEGAAGGVEGIPMDLHHPVRRVDDVELEGVEDQVGAEPYEFAAPHVEVRPERRRVPRPYRRVDPVRPDHEVVRTREVVHRRRLGVEAERDPELGASHLEDSAATACDSSPQTRAPPT